MTHSGIVLVLAHAAYPVTEGAVLKSTLTNNPYDGLATVGSAIGANCEGIHESSGLFLSNLVFASNTIHDNGEGIYLI
jgi:hypothetical protein